jgi:pyruvate/2-oxoglutarate/acetoin dehydrogenase E1 component
MTVMSYLGAIGAAQREAMEADPRVIIIGEDVQANVYGTMGAANRAPTGATSSRCSGPSAFATRQSPKK